MVKQNTSKGKYQFMTQTSWASQQNRCRAHYKIVCQMCPIRKQVSKPVPKEVQTKAQKALELVYSDILGPFEV
jgi:hypothetical protein